MTIEFSSTGTTPTSSPPNELYYEDDIDLEYGPGIVARLKSKFLRYSIQSDSVTPGHLHHNRRNNLNNKHKLKRFSSLEDILEPAFRSRVSSGTDDVRDDVIKRVNTCVKNPQPVHQQQQQHLLHHKDLHPDEDRETGVVVSAPIVPPSTTRPLLPVTPVITSQAPSLPPSQPPPLPPSSQPPTAKKSKRPIVRGSTLPPVKPVIPPKPKSFIVNGSTTDQAKATTASIIVTTSMTSITTSTTTSTTSSTSVVPTMTPTPSLISAFAFTPASCPSSSSLASKRAPDVKPHVIERQSLCKEKVVSTTSSSAPTTAGVGATTAAAGEAAQKPVVATTDPGLQSFPHLQQQPHHSLTLSSTAGTRTHVPPPLPLRPSPASHPMVTKTQDARPKVIERQSLVKKKTLTTSHSLPESGKPESQTPSEKQTEERLLVPLDAGSTTPVVPDSSSLGTANTPTATTASSPVVAAGATAVPALFSPNNSTIITTTTAASLPVVPQSSASVTSNSCDISNSINHPPVAPPIPSISRPLRPVIAKPVICKTSDAAIVSLEEESQSGRKDSSSETPAILPSVRKSASSVAAGDSSSCWQIPPLISSHSASIIHTENTNASSDSSCSVTASSTANHHPLVTPESESEAEAFVTSSTRVLKALLDLHEQKPTMVIGNGLNNNNNNNHSNSMVFDFRGKNVKPQLAIKSPFGRSAVIGPEDGDADSVTDSGLSPSDLSPTLVFLGENEIIGNGSLLKVRNKKLRIHFNEASISSTYEYPSESCLLSHYEQQDEDRSHESSTRKQVTSSHPHNREEDGTPADALIKPANSDEASPWSASSSACDLLF